MTLYDLNFFKFPVCVCALIEIYSGYYQCISNCVIFMVRGTMQSFEN